MTDTFFLTIEQQDAMADSIKQLKDASRRDEPGSIVAQLFVLSNGEVQCKCRFLTQGQVLAISPNARPFREAPRGEMTMTTEELLQVIADAKLRKDVAEAYSIAVEVGNREGVDFSQVNAAIADKWGRPGLLYIKEQAWRLHDQRAVTNHQEGL